MAGPYGGKVAIAGMGALNTASGTTASLPAGAVLGMAREEDGIRFRLFYNAGNSAINPGFAATPRPIGSGAYSVTVTSTSKTFDYFGACVVHHATVPTANYFWGATRGYLASGVAADAATITTGAAFYLAADGKMNLMPQSVVTGNRECGICLNGPTAGTVAVRQSSVFLNLEQ